MKPTLSIRMPAGVRRRIERGARRLRITPSEFVRQAVDRFLLDLAAPELGGHFDRVAYLIGSCPSGVPDLGTAHEKHLKVGIRRRARRRPA